MRKKGVVFLILTFFLLLFSVQMILQSGFFSEKAKIMAEKGLESFLGRKIDIEGASLRPFSASISLKGVTGAPKETPPFSAKEIRIYFSPWSLITQSFLIRQIVIESPSVTLESNTLARPPFSLKGSPEKSPPSVVVRSIRIVNGTLTYQSGAEVSGVVQTVSLGGINVEISSDLRMSRFEIDLSAETGQISIEQGSREVGRSMVKAVIRPEEIEIITGSIVSGRATFQTSGSFKPAEQRVDLQVDLHLPLEETGLPVVTERNLSGEWIGQGRLSGAYPNFTFTGKTTLPHLFSNGAEIGSFSSDLSYQDRKLLLPSFSGELFSGTFSGEGEADFSGEHPDDLAHYRTSVQYNHLPLDKLRHLMVNAPSPLDPAFEGIFLDGNFLLSGKGTGPADWKGGGQAEAKRLPLFSPPVPIDAERTVKLISLLQEGVFQWRWMGDRLLLDQGKVIFSQAEATFHGGWGEAEGLSIEVAATAEEVGHLARLADLPITGASQFEGTVSGKIDRPRVEGRLLLDRWALHTRPMGTLTAHFSLHNRMIDLKEGTLGPSTPAGKKEGPPPYRFTGKIAWDNLQPITFDFKTQIASADPQPVLRYFDLSIPLQTTATGTLSIQGTPERFTVKGPLRLTRGLLYGERFDRGRLDLTVNEKKTLLQNLKIERTRGSVSGEGEIRYDGTYRFSAKATGLSIDEIEIIQAKTPLLSGELSFEATGEGSFKKPKMKVIAAIERFRYGEIEERKGTIEIDWNEDRLLVNGNLPERNFSANGELHLLSPYPFSFQSRFSTFSLDPFIQPLSPLLSRSSLLLTGDLEGNGTLSQIDQINLSGSLRRVSALFGGYAVENDGPITVRADRGAFTFEGIRFKGENTFLEFNGGVTPFQSWNLFAKGEADLNLLSFFSRTVTSGKGKATLDLRITEQWSTPSIRGTLALQDGTVRTVIFPQSIHISSLSVAFNERIVLLETFEGETGRGHFRANGKADLVGFGVGSFGFLLEVNETRLPLPQDLTGIVSGELLFQREGTVQSLKGELTIKKALYSKRIDLKSWMVDWKQGREEGPVEETPLIGKTKLNIHLLGRENIWIDNNIAKIPLEVDLFLKGTVDRPLLIGRIESPRGTVHFRRNEFRITSGSVEFLSPDRIDPRFDIKAKTEVRGQEIKYEIDLGLVGTLSKFTLTLASSPVLPEADILALLAFGKTTTEIAQIQKGGGGGEAAGLILSELLEGPLQKMTGVDRIQVDPYAGGFKSSSGPRLTAEKRLLDDRLRVTYSTTLDPSQEQLIRMIYDLGKNVSLVGERDEYGHIGGEVRFRLEFR